MSEPSPPEQFAAALRDLHEAAGAPVYALLVHQAAQQRPQPVKFSEQSLSDWLGNVAVPANPAAVRFLVAYLNPLARGRGHQIHDAEWWRALYKSAREARRARRGGRPPTRVRTAGADPTAGPGAAVGQSIATFADCVTLLGVHDAIEVAGSPSGRLPEYVVREHDRRLRRVVDSALTGTSGAVVLIGDTSTGKSRACWEAVRALPDGWRLWHPLGPRPQTTLMDGIGRVEPGTVLWLDELTWYLDAESATVLWELLADGDRAPVLVLGTVWRADWSRLRASAPAIDRLPLTDRIEVPEAFTGLDLAALARAGHRDPRLRQAERLASGGRITQYLAGTHKLREAYDEATGPQKALLQVAMDLRRHGVQEDPSREFLRDAAMGYADEVTWAGQGEDWLTVALEHLARPLMGVRGPLAPAGFAGPSERAGAAADGTGYRLADFLAQQARFARAGAVPPESFWNAATRHLRVDSIAVLARAALDFGLMRVGARLRRHGLASGSAYHPAELVELIARFDPPGLPHAAAWVSAAIDPADLPTLTRLSEVLDARQCADVLRELHQRAAREISLHDPTHVDDALDLFGKFGQDDAVHLLLRRNPAGHVRWPVDPFSGGLDRTLRELGAHAQADMLAERAAEERAARRPELARRVSAVDPADTSAVVDLLHDLRAADEPALVQQLLDRDVAGLASLDDLGSILWLLSALAPGPDADRILGRIRSRASNAPIGWTVNYVMMRHELVRQLWHVHDLLPPPTPTFELTAEHLKHVRRLAGHCATPEQYTVLCGLIGVGAASGELPERELQELTTTVQQADPELGAGLVRTLAREASPSQATFIAWLLGQLRAQQDQQPAADLLDRVPWPSVAGDLISFVIPLVEELDRAGRADLIRRIIVMRLAARLTCARLLPHLADADLRQVAAGIDAGDTTNVAAILDQAHRRGLHELTTQLAERTATEADITRSAEVLTALTTLRRLGHTAAIQWLLARDPAGRLLRNWGAENALDELLTLLHDLAGSAAVPGAAAQLDRLIARIAGEAMFVRPTEAARFAAALHRVGAGAAVPRLARLLADTGEYREARRIDPGWSQRYRNGREPNGDPAAPWGWDDLT